MNSEAARTTEAPPPVDMARYRKLQRQRLGTLPPAISSTEWQERGESPNQERLARAELLRLARLSEDEVFEDGIENSLSRGLTRLLVEFGAAATRALRDAYVSREISPSVLEEALRWLATSDDDQTKSDRFWLFVWALREPDRRVKDASTLALTSLEDPRAASYLAREAEHETLPALRAFMLASAQKLREADADDQEGSGGTPSAAHSA